MLAGVVLILAVRPLVTAAGSPSGASSSLLSPQPAVVGHAAYVVRSGDTLWSIARSVQPDGDVRPLVDELSRARRGAPLQPGDRVLVPWDAPAGD